MLKSVYAAHALKIVTAALVLAGVAATTGCGGSQPPSQLTVTLPDGSATTVSAGSGAKSLANTKWQFFRVAGNAQGAAFATIRFGDDGNLEAFEDNTLAANIFGDEIVFDNSRRATKQFGLTYQAATFGAETSDGTGFAFEGRMTAYAAGIAAGFGTASAAAEFDDDNPDTVNGTFTFTTEVTLLDIPEANQNDEFNFVGNRVEE